jgi:hypothetical protein
MNQYFFTHNLVKVATPSATSDEIPTSPINAQFPLSNLKDDRRTKVFRSVTNTVSVVFDLGVAQDVDSVLIVDSGLNPFGFISATAQFNSVDSWGSITEETIDIDFEFGFAKLFLPSVQNIRYVRINLVSTSGFCELSKIFIGTKVSVGDLCFSYPVVFTQNNNASIKRNRLGQKFVDEINSQKMIEGAFQTITKDELDELMSILDYASFTRPIWLTFPDGNIMVNNNRINGYYYLDDDPKLQLIPGQYWNVSLKFTEGT